MLALPGGVASAWEADEDAVLWVTTDEPTLAFEGGRAPRRGRHGHCGRRRDVQDWEEGWATGRFIPLP